MRRAVIPALALFSLVPLAALAQHNHAAMTQMANAPTAAKADAMSEGVVKKIDRKAGEVTIAHGPLTNLGMGPMTMTFKLKSSSLVDGIKESGTVQFVAQNVNNELTVVALKTAQ